MSVLVYSNNNNYSQAKPKVICLEYVILLFVIIHHNVLINLKFIMHHSWVVLLYFTTYVWAYFPSLKSCGIESYLTRALGLLSGFSLLFRPPQVPSANICVFFYHLYVFFFKLVWRYGTRTVSKTVHWWTELFNDWWLTERLLLKVWRSHRLCCYERCVFKKVYS